MKLTPKLRAIFGQGANVGNSIPSFIVSGEIGLNDPKVVVEVLMALQLFEESLNVGVGYNVGMRSKGLFVLVRLWGYDSGYVTPAVAELLRSIEHNDIRIYEQGGQNSACAGSCSTRLCGC